MYGSHLVGRGKQQRRTSGPHKTHGNVYSFLVFQHRKQWHEFFFRNGKSVRFPQNTWTFVISCVTLALREYCVCFRDFVIVNNLYQSLTHLNANL